MSLASVVCALSPSIGVMMIARLVQGFSGGWAMVIARSLVVDLASGAHLVKSLNLVQGVAGVAPIVGPLLGAAILQLSHWRVSFWLLAIWIAVMLLTVALAVPETLPVERRHAGGLRHLRAAASRVLRSRGFVGYLVVMAFSMGVTFAYVATSAFVLQSMNGLSPVVYSVDFAANAVGLTIATLVAARLAGRIPTRAVIAVGLAATASAGMLLLGGALWFDMPLGVAVVAFFVLMTAQGLIGPNAGALASGEVPDHPGTGSAVLGFLQWCTAGVIAPIAGSGGDRTAVPMALIVLTLVVISFAALALASPRTDPQPADPSNREEPAMRAVTMYGPGDVRVVDREEPRIIEPTDAVIRLTATCICGSDLWPYRGAEAAEHLLMGHEYVGIVEEIGDDVKTPNLGTSSSAPSSSPTTPARSAWPATSPVRARRVRPRQHRHPVRASAHPVRRRDPGRHPGHAR